MLVSDFNYNLSEDRIAKYPPIERGTTRLMVIHPSDGKIEHKRYFDVVDYINEGDIVVLNYTKVQKVRTRAVVERTGREVEVMFLENVQYHEESAVISDKNKQKAEYWYALIGRARHVKTGDTLTYPNGETVTIISRPENETGFIVRINSVNSETIFNSYGTVPLPPYMHRKAEESDGVRYNTVFAEKIGSVAAPTASLNLTRDLMSKIESKGAEIVYVELKIGWGTFAPVSVDKVEDVEIHEEHYCVSEESATKINEAIKNGGKVWAFGTTTARVLESTGVIASDNRQVVAGKGSTKIFISPGYKWKIVDRLVTNFHVPQSTLLMMVSAFAGKDLTLKAYNTALEMNYDFLSYGDSMVVVKEEKN